MTHPFAMKHCHRGLTEPSKALRAELFMLTTADMDSKFITQDNANSVKVTQHCNCYLDIFLPLHIAMKHETSYTVCAYMRIRKDCYVN